MNYYAFDPPTIMVMGSVGDEPIIASCADCGAETAIAGKLASGPAFHETGVLKTPNGGFTLAYFCQPCFDARLAEKPVEN